VFNNASQVFDAVRSRFGDFRVLVAGDLMLDQYIWGTVERISPEAPVPVLRIDHKSLVAGGAANVAANLRGLGCRVAVAGLVGMDQEGQHLLGILQALGIETSSVLPAPGVPTTCKTRILGGQQQMLRLDIESGIAPCPELKAKLLASVEASVASCSAVVLSDYGKGLLDESVCQTIIRRSRELSIPVFVDPKGSSYGKYAGCDTISPNRIELATATASDSRNVESLLEKGQKLRMSLGISRLAATLGELGIALLDSHGIRKFPALAREVFDVSGAGDTVIATLAASISGGLEFDDAIRLANLAASIVIGKVGTVPISRDELLAALPFEREPDSVEKICSVEMLLRQVAAWHFKGRRIVFTNGCFDLFHVGHLSFLEQAKRKGDCLIVALNTDRSIRALKGSGRPIVSEEARAKLLAALPCVDAVVLFNEETPLDLLRALRPDILVKGSNYLEEDVVGAEEMKEWGGRVSLIPVVGDSSTTAILRKVIASQQEDSRDVVQ
jgi:D-beta-D-heptose 7-phosphate kinase / D-beta-D-heptose 1-phosphate adenosyltransferase